MSKSKQLRDAGIRMSINQRAGTISRLAFEPIRQDLRAVASELVDQGKSSEEVIALIDQWGDGCTVTWTVVGRPRA